MIRPAIVFLSALILFGCKKQEIVAEPPAAGAYIQPGDLGAATRVVGIRFNIPGEGDSTGPRPSGFTWIGEGGLLDFEHLKQSEEKSEVLTDAQTEKLVEAVYGEHPKFHPAACYDPHHIFIFFDDEGQMVHVIEVCFSCTNIRAFPDMEESQWMRHDFRALARLCDEIGIGVSTRSANEYIELLDQRDATSEASDE